MNALKLVWAETFGLFVDDGALALQVVVLIAIIASAVKFAGLEALVGGFALLVGCLAILAASLWRKARG